MAGSSISTRVPSTVVKDSCAIGNADAAGNPPARRRTTVLTHCRLEMSGNPQRSCSAGASTGSGTRRVVTCITTGSQFLLSGTATADTAQYPREACLEQSPLRTGGAASLSGGCARTPELMPRPSNSSSPNAHMTQLRERTEQAGDAAAEKC